MLRGEEAPGPGRSGSPGPDISGVTGVALRPAGAGVRRLSSSPQLAIVGTPERVADQLASYVEAGAERIAVISDLTPWSESWPEVAEVRRLLNG